MNQEIKQKWIAALRSGMYRQGRYFLKEEDNFCCLGVLCDLHSKETGRKWQYRNKDYYYFDSQDILPIEIIDWANMKCTQLGEIPNIGDSLASLNDSGSSFHEIADIIEEEF